MYYHLRQTPVMEGLYIAIAPRLHRRINWLSGKPFAEPVPEPLTVNLDDRFGTTLPDILTDTILLMSNRLIDALQRAGVSNFNLYEVELEEPNGNVIKGEYKAVQILGRVTAANMENSDVFDPLNMGHTLVQFRKLALDEGKIQRQGLFRLQESASTIIVDEAVKREIEKVELKFVSVVPVGEVSYPE